MTREEAIKKLESLKISLPDAKDEISDIIKLIETPWISVEDDLPCNHSDLVLTYNDTPFSTKRVIVVTDIHTLFLCEMKKDNNRRWIWNYSTKDKITHWFPIPELPKE